MQRKANYLSVISHAKQMPETNKLMQKRGTSNNEQCKSSLCTIPQIPSLQPVTEVN